MAFFRKRLAQLALSSLLAAFMLQAAVAQSVQTSTAILAEPTGVFAIEVRLPPDYAGSLDVEVHSDDGRARFFATETIYQEFRAQFPRRRGAIRDRIRNLINGDDAAKKVPVAVVVTGIFEGGESFNVNLNGLLKQTVRLQPAASAAGTDHVSLLANWWEAYSRARVAEVRQYDIPKLVHQYLLSTLQTRFGLPAVSLEKPDEEEDPKSLTIKTFELLAAVDEKHETAVERLLSGTNDLGKPQSPIPSGVAWPSIPAAAGANQNIAIEPMASVVPAEWLYLRFGEFSNYVWFQELSERFGGDLAQAVLLRSFTSETSQRVERMLATKLTSMAKMFGDQLVADMAVVGSDLYLKEGASLGVIMYAKNMTLLKTAVDADRRSAAAKNPAATLQQVQIAGERVSLLSTPDNTVRSFMATKGQAIFVSTSERLTERFLSAGPEDCLATDPQFRWTRQWMPTENEYGVFAYFSPQFFQTLVGPHYQVELRRRMNALAHIDVAELADQLATAEGSSGVDADGLKSRGLLPQNFGVLPVSEIAKDNQGWFDAVRGRRGSFVPIADMDVGTVTAEEAAMCAENAEYFGSRWQSMDPMVFGLRRFRDPIEPTVEVVAVEGYIAPFEADKYGWIAKQLGAPTSVTIRQPETDVASVQMHLRGDAGLLASGQDYYIFAGIKDTIPPSETDTDGLFKLLGVLRTLPAYVGAWPKPDIVEQLPFGIGLNFSRPDYAGYSRLLIGLWRWQNDSFSLLSFDKAIIDEAVRTLAAEASTDNAQVRMQVQNLRGTQLEGWVNSKWYDRAWRDSQGIVSLLELLERDFGIAPQDCLEAAERLIDVKVQCPMGGKYVHTQASGFRSTAWAELRTDEAGKAIAPAGYQAPWVEWFRGGRAHVTQQPGSLSLVAEVRLEMPKLQLPPETDQPAVLPPLSFDLFSLPGQLFGGTAGKADAESTPRPPRRSF